MGVDEESGMCPVNGRPGVCGPSSHSWLLSLLLFSSAFPSHRLLLPGLQRRVSDRDEARCSHCRAPRSECRVEHTLNSSGEESSLTAKRLTLLAPTHARSIFCSSSAPAPGLGGRGAATFDLGVWPLHLLWPRSPLSAVCSCTSDLGAGLGDPHSSFGN